MPQKQGKLIAMLAGSALLAIDFVCGQNTTPARSPVPLMARSSTSPFRGDRQAAGDGSRPLGLAAFPGGTTAQPYDVAGFLTPEDPQVRRVILEFPSTIRIGDSDTIRLSLEIDGVGNVAPAAAAQSQGAPGPTSDIRGPYDSYNVIAEAALDLPGMDLRPAGPVSQPLLYDKPDSFIWSIKALGTDTYRGTAWLFLIFYDKATSKQTRQALYAQSFAIQATSLIGADGGSARVVGGMGSLLGGALMLPFLRGLVPRRAARAGAPVI